MLAPDAALEIFDEIDSTMEEARRRAARGDFAPVWLMARTQTAGRGRRGRAWNSRAGNLMATYYGVAKAPPATLALLGFAAGVAIAEAVSDDAGETPVSLKWPNDVLMGGAKIAGLMLDTAAAPGGHWLALGFGVNIAEAPEGLDQPTAALAQTARAPPTPESLLARIRARLERWSMILAGQGFAPVREAWLARAHAPGAPLHVRAGSDLIAGRFAGLSAQGELELATPDGVRRIAVGDIVAEAREAT